MISKEERIPAPGYGSHGLVYVLQEYHHPFEGIYVHSNVAIERDGVIQEIVGPFSRKSAERWIMADAADNAGWE